MHRHGIGVAVDGLHLTNADIDAVCRNLKLQVYDPVGNLAAPPANLRCAAVR
jgi:hypothetical protein